MSGRLTRFTSRSRTTVAAATGLAIAAVGVLAVACGPAASPDPSARVASPTTSGTGSSTQQTSSFDAPAPAPPSQPGAGTRPVRVQIPSIGVDSGLQALGSDKSGALQTPSRWQRAGWYAAGIRPGEVGPAVIAGHVDSTAGPAVFFRLHALRTGARVLVTRHDGRRLTFVVDDSREYPKHTFPTDAVYGPTSLPVLRLITCTGDFDQAKHSYVDNLVVTSHLQEQ